MIPDSTHIKAQIIGRLVDIPFAVELSLKYLIEYWRDKSSSFDANKLDRLAYIESYLVKYPFLEGPLNGIEDLAEHYEFVRCLIEPVLTEEGWSNRLMEVAAPFSHTIHVYVSPAYQKVLDNEDLLIDMAGSEDVKTRSIYAFKSILNEFYDIDIKVDLPVVISIYNTDNGLRKYFKLQGDIRFSRVICNGPTPPIDKEALKSLLEKPFVLEDWTSVIPLENFKFVGVVIISYTDITIEESTKRIQYDLLYKSGTKDDDQLWLENIQEEVRSLLALPELRVGIASLQKNGKLNLTSHKALWNSLIARSNTNLLQKHFDGSIYSEVLDSGRVVVLENITNTNDPILSLVKASGFQNIIITPLYHNDEVVGILELADPQPGSINAFSLFKINQIRPVFANALKTNQEEFENKVEAEMLEEYTAIHPTISWRFREAAINSLNNNSIEEIIFKDLYPFYSSLDIRNSSKRRSQAIFMDLMNNLEAAQEILDRAYQKTEMPYLDELIYFIKEKVEKITNNRSTEDEVSTGKFIKERINPTIKYLKTNFSFFDEIISQYYQRTDPETQVFVEHRQNYEHAIMILNKTISEYLDKEELKLQSIVPCLFERFQTDGVEYNIYLGKSLSRESSFNPLYLDDVRIRQLKWTYNIMKLVSGLWENNNITSNDNLESSNSPIELEPLEIAPLILVYSNLLTLKFDMDEKRLDVDGSYNVRYEIMKKRIDKASVLGTGQRLTQPGHIAIVYSNENDADIYRKHFHYLERQGYFPNEWEELELEPMAGVEGLKALRIKPVF